MNLSIKNVPEKLVKQLRRRAEINHRSLQGELLTILELAARQERGLTPSELYERVKALGLRTPDEATAVIREDRDAR
ncbi:MAG: Arc family DNA-binding protein [Candidatus Binataceae bacterium]